MGTSSQNWWEHFDNFQTDITSDHNSRNAGAIKDGAY